MTHRISDIPYSAVTPKSVYLNRRRFLAGALGLAGGASAATRLSAVKSPLSTTEKPTPYQDVTSYNNFYEFGTSKSDPAHNAKNLRTIPWTISIEGPSPGRRYSIWMRC
jgi:sulfoxide reductase catalytic subunit YedY